MRMQSVSRRIGRVFGTVATTLIASMALPAMAAAATYYVATNGDDARSCATAQSITTPKRTIASGLACLTAGDTLDIRSGTYPERLSLTKGGTSASPITIQGHVGETVTVKPALNGNIVRISGASARYLVLDNLIFDGALQPGGEEAGGFQIESSNNSYASGPGWNTYKNLQIKNTYRTGVYLGRFDNGHNLWRNVKVSNAGRCFGTPYCNNNTSTAIRESGGVGFYMQSNNNTFDQIEVADVYGYGMQVYHGFTDVPQPSGNVISRSKWHGNGKSGKGSNLYVSGSNNQVVNNVFYDGANGYGIMVQGGASNTLVYNNTVTRQVLAGIYIGTATGTVVKNNISYGNGEQGIANNGTSTTLSSNLITDPMFVDPSAGNFRLKSLSPAIDSGVQLPAVTLDLDARPRPQGNGYDIGAYEYGSVVALPAPAAPTNVRVVSGL